MIIRATQQQSLAADLQDEFEEKMTVHLRTGFADEVGAWDDDELRRFIRRGMEKAFDYNIKIEADVARFIEYAASYGEDFDLDPHYRWARPVLESEKINGTKKMDALDRLNYAALNAGE